MSTLDDNIIALGVQSDANTAKILAAIAAIPASTGGAVDLTPVLSAIAEVQTTSNAILAQDLPTPPAA